MLPRWHILFGAIFTIIIWLVAPNISPIFLVLVFLSSFLIDFDHYAASLLKTKKWKLRDSFEYHRKKGIEERQEIAKGIKRKSDFHLFHTIEFHAFVGVLGVLSIAFFYIFIGMVFHSLLDVSDLLKRKAIHRREYFFFSWLRKKI